MRILLALLFSIRLTFGFGYISVDGGGTMTFPEDVSGYKVPEFSYVGYNYMGADDLPVHGVDYTTNETVVLVDLATNNSEATATSNWNAIQAAIDAVELDALVGDFRGSVDLPAGNFYIHNDTTALTVEKSGIVIRGAGKTATKLIEYGKDGAAPSHNIRIGLPGSGTTSNKSNLFEVGRTGTHWDITTAEVKPGDLTFDLEPGHGVTNGMEIVIEHLGGSAWITAVDNGGVSADPAWAVDEVNIRYWRTVTAVATNTITIDSPIFYNLVKATQQCTVYEYTETNTIENVGIENLHWDVDRNSGQDSTTTNSTQFHAIEFFNVKHGFARNVEASNFRVTGILATLSRNISITDSDAVDPHAPIDPTWRYNFSGTGVQNIFYENCLGDDGRHNFITNGWGADSGIVYLNCTSKNNYSNGIEAGHQKFSHGFLYDNMNSLKDVVAEVGESYFNKELWIGNHQDASASFGWTGGNSVIYKGSVGVSPAFGIIQVPPTTGAWAFDTQSGTYSDNNTDIPLNIPSPTDMGPAATFSGTLPASLYETQLSQRLLPPDDINITTVNNLTLGTLRVGF